MQTSILSGLMEHCLEFLQKNRISAKCQTKIRTYPRKIFHPFHPPLQPTSSVQHLNTQVYLITLKTRWFYESPAKLLPNKIWNLWLKNPAEIQLVVDRKVAVGNLWDDGFINKDFTFSDLTSSFTFKSGKPLNQKRTHISMTSNSKFTHT